MSLMKSKQISEIDLTNEINFFSVTTAIYLFRSWGNRLV